MAAAQPPSVREAPAQHQAAFLLPAENRGKGGGGGEWGWRVSLGSNSQGMGFLDSVIKARFIPVWCNLTPHKAQIMINELFTKAEPTPVALSHTNFPQMSPLSSD